jgi:regulator of extracellular matrix RemA (YlzA/DUF370 family)
MGYMLPLKFVKISSNASENQFDVAICATRIVAIMSTENFQARRTVKEEKRAGTLINAAGRSAVKSVIFLDNGSVAASPLTVQRLLTAIEKSNYKSADPKRVNETVRLKVYDVVDEEPNEDLDEDFPDVSVIDVDAEDDEPVEID